jgi:hypothetical protein
MCIADLEKRLTDACDEIISCANAYDGIGPLRTRISDLTEEHGFDKTYTPLLLKMLGECSEVFAFESSDDEIKAYRQEKEQTQTDSHGYFENMGEDEPFGIILR